MGQMQSFRMGQDPMNAGNPDPVLGCESPDLPALGRVNPGDVLRDREGRNLDGIVPGLGGIGEGVFQFPVLEDFVADGESHAPYLSGPAPQTSMHKPVGPLGRRLTAIRIGRDGRRIGWWL